MTTHRFWIQASMAAVIAISSTVAIACNVPVFRYALERWRPDLCQVIVFHAEGLTTEQEQELQTLGKATIAQGGIANAEIIQSKIGSETDRGRKELWEALSRQPNVRLPFVVMRTSLGTGELVTHWSGPLQEVSKAHLVDSPIRRELARRLLVGDSVVWLMLKSDDASKNKATRDLLATELERLGKTLKLPDGIGLPGSELYSEVPLFLKFTILELDPKDPAEQLLVRLMSGFEKDANNEPLLAPVFGRGRALEVISAKQLNAGLIEDLTMFLCGACSCQVKERNPGFDLLLATNWNSELYGEDGEAPPPVASLERTPTKPTPLTIPPGRKR
ncbi:MAG: hypothetical protein NTY15_05855 [Planctomycetota bacterium]|nr:hypothetical protein [Planctomycetota bacterium]